MAQLQFGYLTFGWTTSASALISLRSARCCWVSIETSDYNLLRLYATRVHFSMVTNIYAHYNACTALLRDRSINNGEPFKKLL